MARRAVSDMDSPLREKPGGFWSRAAPMYERVGPQHFLYYAQVLVEFGVQPGDRVLDVATGAGAVLREASGRVGPAGHVVGVDITPAMLARAEEEVIERSLRNIELRLMDGEHLEFPAGSFDVVLCSFGLQAFSDERAALRGFYRVLGPAGRVAVAYPLGWPFDTDPRWKWEADVLRSFGALPEEEADRRPNDVVSAMREAGFVHITADEVVCPLDFRDEEEWWSWSWSHGTRTLFEAVLEERLPALRDALFDGLKRCKGEDGQIHGSVSAIVARASKAGAPAM
jgi:O-methyltransferase/aklanonic acid methyltransferase